MIQHIMHSFLLLASVAGNFAKHLASELKASGIDVSKLSAVFITTAANPYSESPWIEDDITAFKQAGFVLKRFDLAEQTEAEVRKVLASTDLCIVGGGNTIYLLEEILKKNVLNLFSERVAEGMIYVGSSAGAVIAGPQIEFEVYFEDRKDPVKLNSYSALNLCNFHIMPHWGSENFKTEYMTMLGHTYKQTKPLVTLTDEQAVLVTTNKMLQFLGEEK